MKIIITLKEKEESIKFMQDLRIEELKESFSFAYISNLDITLKGNFLLSFTGLTFWLENEDNILLRIPVELVKDLVIKENQ